MSRDLTIAWRCPSCGLSVPILKKELGLTLHCQCGFSEIPRRGLGDCVAAFLGRLGITEERYASWHGIELGECGCQRRREKLNRWGRWAVRWRNRMYISSTDWSIRRRHSPLF